METEQERDGETSWMMDKMFVGGGLIYSETIIILGMGRTN